MRFTETLTIVFIVLKLTGQITWHWLLVLSPTLFILLAALALSIMAGILGDR